ncbi:GNAT family N-acetyltransferase [Neobacillus sp. D3-1R]|uniref:GNAT family N-acetyltransferase n=1 Tax=Neobacillus sp. D3-1R TaxID=3445778 RepID=UPI003FA0AC83
MIFELKKNDYIKIKPLLRGLEDHPVINGVIQGNNVGKIFVDNLDEPTTSLVWAKMEMFYLIGNCENHNFTRQLESFIFNTIKPEALAIGDTDFNLEVYPYQDWIEKVPNLFSVSLKMGYRVPFIFEKDSFKHFFEKPFTLAEGYEIHLIDQNVIHMDRDRVIEEEILKFWESLDQFLNIGIGYCITNNDNVIGTCISVFVADKEYEIGINTYSTEHRGKGLATALAREFVRECLHNGYTPHWTTESFRMDSIAIAKKIGFKQLPNYKVFYLPFEGWVIEV